MKTTTFYNIKTKTFTAHVDDYGTVVITAIIYRPIDIESMFRPHIKPKRMPLLLNVLYGNPTKPLENVDSKICSKAFEAVSNSIMSWGDRNKAKLNAY